MSDAMRPDARAQADIIVGNLYADHGGALRLRAYHLTRDRQRAEDLVQETLLRAWQHAHKLRDDLPSQRAWLFRVARNIAIDDLRHRRRRPTEIYADPPTSFADDTDQLLSAIAMSQVLRELSLEHRSVLVEIFYRGSTTREAADALRIPHGTAKSRLHYGLRRLRTKLPAVAAG